MVTMKPLATHCECGYEFSEGMSHCPMDGKKRSGWISNDQYHRQNYRSPKGRYEKIGDCNYCNKGVPINYWSPLCCNQTGLVTFHKKCCIEHEKTCLHCRKILEANTVRKEAVIA